MSPAWGSRLRLSVAIGVTVILVGIVIGLSLGIFLPGGAGMQVSGDDGELIPGDPSGGGDVIYGVNGNVSEGAIVTEFRKGGRVQQPFKSPGNRLNSVGVVTSRDPSRGPAFPADNCSSGTIGRVLYEIVDESGMVLNSQELPACRDMPTEWKISPPLLIDPDQVYILRTTNVGETILSIYFNNSGNAEPHSSLEGAIDSTGAQGKSVSGVIRAG